MPHLGFQVGTSSKRGGLYMKTINEYYNEDGYFLAKGLLDSSDFLDIEDLAKRVIRNHWKELTYLNDLRWVSHASANPNCVAKIYDEIRDHEVFLRLGLSSKITSIVSKLIRAPALYKKVPFRIDVPFETKELAFWHQDDFYVKGNDEELTVWIPLFDTKIHQGPLQVMPRSHRNGKVPHTLKVGKKTLPADGYDNEIRYVEMARGDVLFFSSFLLHASSLNISDEIRYSIQLRYSSSLKSQSSEMKGIISV
jgi:ectoine hydroxylase-related dioxygenase (phytanoyl-CoA dioxygenase family)